MSKADDASRFLRALFDGVEPAQRFLIWTLPDKRSTWYSTSAAAEAAVAAMTLEQHDVYVGVGLSDRDRGSRQRVQAKQVCGIVGLWADVDFADDEAHKGKNYPPDEASAMELLAAIGPEPSIIVHSGHGLQAWWLFDEPWLFDDAEERARAASLSSRWNLTLRVRAGERGWTIDSTHDLSRVMRLPGTTNHKRKDHPVTVRIVTASARRRYGPSDLEGYCADDTALTMLAGRRTHSVGALTLLPGANPPFDKFQAMLANDTKFRKSWERTRTDLQDDSASSYDLSLASIAVIAGWTDQEIADLILASRRSHGDDQKLRQDYYARTIARARDTDARSLASEEIETTVARVEHAQVLGDEAGVNRAKRELVDQVSHLLGVEVTRLVRFVQDPPRYKLETPAGSVTLGTADVILNQTKMRAAIASATSIVIPRAKGPKWDSIAQAIFAACEDEDTGIESTEEGIAYSWIIEYLQDRPVLEDRTEAASTLTPYRDADHLFLFGSAFRRWLWMSRGDRVSASRMGEILRAFGCEHHVVNVVLDGTRTSRSVWQVPGLDLLSRREGSDDETPTSE